MTDNLDTWEHVAHDATHTWPEAEPVPITESDPVLHKAAYCGGVAQLAMALDGIDNVDKEIPFKHYSPLHLAIRSDQAESVRLLLTAGADPRKPQPFEYTCYDSGTAIEVATHFGSEKSLMVLADHGIEISNRAFSEAVAGNHVSCIQAILQRWQDGSQEKSQIVAAMRKAIMRAAPLFCQEALEVLLNTVPGFPDAKVEADRKALTWAMRAMLAQWDETEGCQAVYLRYNPRTRPIAEMLIAAGAEVDSRAFWACLYPAEDRIVHLLLDNGLDVHDRRGFDTWFAAEVDDERPPLILAVVRVAEDDLSILEEFLAKGASALTTDEDLNTPLHSVAHVSFVRLLLKHGANVDARNKQGRTPLYVACAEKRLDVAAELIAHGADVRTITKDESWVPLVNQIVDRFATTSIAAPPFRF
ncbi:Ankyrin-2 [Curvularia kusanoi]|uniref:Ankyrin-2 n=1 Tax=Curvularia kusanoi TaxID=90978 RepID=A0A9P4TGS9_CURKU|nr:Ankyrin-2 [Curvularia kusanoi]